MSNYNKVLLMGRLTRDPELRYTPQGVPVTDIGLAINREYTAGEERRKDTTFVDVTVWRRAAATLLRGWRPPMAKGAILPQSRSERNFLRR